MHLAEFAKCPGFAQSDGKDVSNDTRNEPALPLIGPLSVNQHGEESMNNSNQEDQNQQQQGGQPNQGGQQGGQKPGQGGQQQGGQNKPVSKVVSNADIN